MELHPTLEETRRSEWARELSLGPSGEAEGPRLTVYLSDSGVASTGAWPEGLDCRPASLDALTGQLRERRAERLVVAAQGAAVAVAGYAGARKIDDYRVYGGKPPTLPDGFASDMRTTAMAQTDPEAFDAAYMASAARSKDPFYREGARHSLQLLRHWAATEGTGVGHAFWLPADEGAQDETLVAVGSYRRLDQFTALGQHVGVVPSHRGARRAFMVGFELAEALHIDGITWLICFISDANKPSYSYLEAAGHKVTGQFELFELEI